MVAILSKGDELIMSIYWIYVIYLPILFRVALLDHIIATVPVK